MNEYRNKITPVSQGLLQEAVRTLPFQPIYAEITLAAEGIALEDDQERYVHECSEKSVIPFSSAKFEYDSRTDLFMPARFEGSRIHAHGYSEQTKKGAIQGLIKGGRIHLITTEIGIPAQEGFQTFRDEFLGMLLDCGYELNTGDLWLEGRHSKQHYAEGEHRAGGLSFDISREFELQFNEQTPDADKLVEWFNRLAEKYHCNTCLTTP